MGKKLYGHVSKDNLQYEWKSEPGACKVCQAMDGTIYESANDIPDRPHPNCKCWIDVQEKDNDENLTDPFEIRKEIYKDKKRSELELGKLSGDAKSLEEEVDEYLRQIESKENELSDFEREIGNIPLEPKDKQKLGDIKEQLDFAKYKGQNAKQKISTLKKDIERVKRDIEQKNIDNDELINLIDRLKYTKDILEEYVVKNMTKEQADNVAEFLSHLSDFKETTALWNLSSSKFENNRKNNDYLTKNGYVYAKIEDLHNTNLERDIKYRLKTETGKDNCKVVVLHNNSSMAKAIIQNNDFKNFLKENIKELEKNKYIPEKSITFKSGDLYNAMHGANVKDIKIDDNGNITLRVEDLYNFEPNRTSVKGRLGEKYQNEGQIENYYVITKLEIPKYIWNKY